MRLTLHSDYALRMLIFLGLQRAERSTIAEIADHYGISENHVMKLAQALARMGYVETQRGRGGGLCLARPAQSIGLGDLVRRTESDFDLVECFSTGGVCPISEACVLRQVLSDALAAFMAVLDRYTLADLLKPPARLRRALGFATVARRTPSSRGPAAAL